MKTDHLKTTLVFGRTIGRDLRTVLAGSRAAGLPEDPLAHLASTLGWLQRAQDRSQCGGVSYGFSLRGGWLAPYVETSGYIIPTFYQAFDLLGDEGYASRAHHIAAWLLTVQNIDGSFSNAKYGREGIVFDTGQCIFGLVEAFKRTRNSAFLYAAGRAADWLVDVLGNAQRWQVHEHNGTPHVYNTRTAWALLEFEQLSPSAKVRNVARRNLDWALVNQKDSGLFEKNAFVEGKTAYTHNISYAVCGLQESGWLLGDQSYVEAAKRCSDAVLRVMRADGFIPGQVGSDGEPTAKYSCATGQAQLAVAWGKQYQKTGDFRYRAGATQALRFLKSRHLLRVGSQDVRGAVPGSFPIWGRYAPFSYPNWAAKFFADALMMELAW